MIRKREGMVTAIRAQRPGVTEIQVHTDGKNENAINYDDLTGPVSLGDKVILNTTAVHLSLGTGGMHFVCFNYRHTGSDISGPGHIMKMRYTPFQIPVLSSEEEEAFREEIMHFKSLYGKPVIIGELHSMVAPAALTLKKLNPTLRIAYLMTDTAALPLSFSRAIHELKQKELLQVTITCGQSFGGDLEAVNVYSGLIAAFMVSGADTVIIAPGPGVAGTGTPYGFSGMETGENVNRVTALGGLPIVIPRISFADRRERHRGISHHTITALNKGAFAPAYLPLPPLGENETAFIKSQLLKSGLLSRHRVCSVMQAHDTIMNGKKEEIELSSMGRGIDDDRYFFASAAAAGILAYSIITGMQQHNGSNNAGFFRQRVEEYGKGSRLEEQRLEE